MKIKSVIFATAILGLLVTSSIPQRIDGPITKKDIKATTTTQVRKDEIVIPRNG